MKANVPIRNKKQNKGSRDIATTVNSILTHRCFLKNFLNFFIILAVF